jgi:hypothetical protein
MKNNLNDRLLVERFKKLSGVNKLTNNVPFERDLFLFEAVDFSTLTRLVGNWSNKQQVIESSNMITMDLTNRLRANNNNAAIYKQVGFDIDSTRIILDTIGQTPADTSPIGNKRWTIPLYLNYGPDAVRRYAQQTANAGTNANMDTAEYQKSGKNVYIGDILINPFIEPFANFKTNDVGAQFQWPEGVYRSTDNENRLLTIPQFVNWLRSNIVDDWAGENYQKAVEDYVQEPVVQDPDPEDNVNVQDPEAEDNVNVQDPEAEDNVNVQDPEAESTDDSDKIYEPIYTPFCKRNLKDGWYDANIVTGNSFLRLGDCGGAVEIAQEFINAVIYKVFNDLDTLEIDGMYGPITIDAVKKVQAKVGTKPDGKYGQATHNSISKFLAAKPKIDQLPIKQKTELDSNPIKLLDLVPIDPAVVSNTGQSLLNKIKAGKQKRIEKRIARLNKKKAKFTRPKQF